MRIVVPSVVSTGTLSDEPTSEALAARLRMILTDHPEFKLPPDRRLAPCVDTRNAHMGIHSQGGGHRTVTQR